MAAWTLGRYQDWSFHEFYDHPPPWPRWKHKVYRRGTVQRHRFFNESVSLGEVTPVPYDYQLSNNCPPVLSTQVWATRATHMYCWYETMHSKCNYWEGLSSSLPASRYPPDVIYKSLDGRIGHFQNTFTCYLLYSNNDISWGYSTQRRTRPSGGRDSPWEAPNCRTRWAVLSRILCVWCGNSALSFKACRRKTIWHAFVFLLLSCIWQSHNMDRQEDRQERMHDMYRHIMVLSETNTILSEAAAGTVPQGVALILNVKYQESLDNWRQL
jgi:hypothetical protein